MPAHTMCESSDQPSCCACAYSTWLKSGSPSSQQVPLSLRFVPLNSCFCFSSFHFSCLYFCLFFFPSELIQIKYCADLCICFPTILFASFFSSSSQTVWTVIEFSELCSRFNKNIAITITDLLCGHGVPWETAQSPETQESAVVMWR